VTGSPALEALCSCPGTHTVQGVPLFEHLDQNFLNRFWSRVDVGDSGECWLWKGQKSAKGYGKILNANRPFIASRIALAVKLGRDILPGHFACHKCDNPPCCNPSHLFEGTPQDNKNDEIAKGRHHRWKGHRSGDGNPKAKLTSKDVRDIRARRAFVSGIDLSKEYGVAENTISNIITGKTWSHLP